MIACISANPFWLPPKKYCSNQLTSITDHRRHFLRVSAFSFMFLFRHIHKSVKHLSLYLSIIVLAVNYVPSARVPKAESHTAAFTIQSIHLCRICHLSSVQETAQDAAHQRPRAPAGSDPTVWVRPQHGVPCNILTEITQNIV